MKPNKIKVHNLDKEVLDYFYSKNIKIPYEGLDQLIIDDIKNGIGATQKYNDSEIRYRIAEVERNKLNKEEAAKIYIDKNDVYSKEAIDNIIKDVDKKLALKLDVTKATNDYLQNKNGIITENLLSADLISKVNARYENKRPVSGGDIGITESDFNNLKIRVGNNEKSISNINNYISTNVLTVSDKLNQNNLDESINNILNTARLTSTPIEYNDLSNELKKIISSSSNGGGGVDLTGLQTQIDTIKNNLYEGNDGEVIFGTTEEGKIEHDFIFIDSGIIITKSSDLSNAKLQAVTRGQTFICDIASNKIYEYNDIQSNWDEVINDTPEEYLKGKFILEYKTNDLYFGIKKIVDISELNTKHESLKIKIEEFNTKIAELNNKIAELNVVKNNISNIEQRLIVLENKINSGTGA